MMDCQRYDFDVAQGATWFQQLAYEIDGEPVNIESWSARMKVRKSYDLPVVVELTTANNRIVIDDVNKVNLELTAVQTAALVPGRYLYDVELVNGPDVERVLFGVFTVFAEVTK
jgi:hypothetical protein